MSEPSTDQLANLVNISENIDDLDMRVAHQFGGEYIDRARLIAVQLNGARWVFARHVDPGLSTVAVVNRALRRPSTVALCLFCVFGIAALLWPPYFLIIEGSVVVHTGFHSIFGTPQGERSPGAINSALLAIELLSLTAIGAISFFIASRIDRALGRTDAIKQ